MTRSSATAPADLESLRMRFERWRRTRKSKTRIPDGLWSAAVELARRYGINRTAAPLRLDGGKLKRLVLAQEPARTLRAHQAQLLLAAGNPETEAPPAWRPLNV